MPTKLTIVEGPPGLPPDLTKIVATVGWAPLLNVGAPATDVVQADAPTGLKDIAGPGLGTDCVMRRTRITGSRTLLVPHAASVAGVISAVTQTGLGPALSVSAVDAHPADDASVSARIVSGGASGVATFQLAVAYNVLGQGNVQPAYGPVLDVPAPLPATVIGTIDLTTLTYVQPATVIGTIDIGDPSLYGPGGSLAGTTLSLDVDAGGVNVYSLPTGSAAPTDADALLALLAAEYPTATFSQSPQGYLTIKGLLLGTDGSLDIAASTSLALLGLSVGTTIGTAGVLDGKTVNLTADAGGAQTLTFGTNGTAPTDAAAVVAAIAGLTNVGASLYSSRNFIRITSDTLGTPSTLQITGGTALALLGLSVMTSAATGAPASYRIDHLGIDITFGTGTHRSGTVHAFTTRAPRPSVTEVIDRLTELDAAGHDFGTIHIAPTFDATTALALASALDTLLATWEGREGTPRAVKAVIGVDVAEDDDVAWATLGAGTFRSRRVDICARGAYVDTDAITDGGRLLRSQSWPAADADALFEFYQDRGEHRLTTQGFPGVYALTIDEAKATTKLVRATGPRFNVMVKGDPGFYFRGGYSFANYDSRFTDASVRNTVLRAFQVAHKSLQFHENRTDLGVKSNGDLDDASSDIVGSSVSRDVALAVVPGGASAVQVTVTGVNFWDTRKISGTIKIQNRVPARDLDFKIGPGLIAGN